MAGATAGKDFMLYIVDNNVERVVCHATDFTISEDYDNIEISGPQSKWRDYLASYAGYTLSVPGVIAYLDDVNIIQLKQWARQGRKLQWLGSAFENGGVRESGTMLITNLTQTAQFRDAMRFDMSAVGCGEPLTNLLPINKVVYLSDFDNVRLPGCPNPYPVYVYWYDGTLIGVADNPDDVTNLFNNYIRNIYYQISPGLTGCDFNMSAAWNSPQPIPDVIYAGAAGMMAMWVGGEDHVLSPDQTDNQVLTPNGQA